jgi:hypothetical protein
MRGFGSDAGGMFVHLDGIGRDGAPQHLAWNVVARRNEGPFIPQIPATWLTRRLLEGAETRRGAMACVGLLPISGFLDEIEGLAIQVSTETERTGAGVRYLKS